MSVILWESLFILFLIIINGFLAMSEIAVISARRARLQHLADSGSRSAQTAVELATDPNNFLSTIQIGITLVGIFAGAFRVLRSPSNSLRYLRLFLRLPPTVNQ